MDGWDKDDPAPGLTPAEEEELADRAANAAMAGPAGGVGGYQQGAALRELLMQHLTE